MTKLVLEEGKFYRNRKGEKVGPVERDRHNEDSIFEWWCLTSNCRWRTDGQYLNTFKTDGDLIEEWKEEPVNKFNVGDKVKATTPVIVSYSYKDQWGVVTEILPDSITGEQSVEIQYPSGLTQVAYVDEDGVVLVEEAKEHQEDDEWGPWTEDFSAYSNCVGLVLAEFNDNGYIRHKVKKSVVKKQIEVGGSYVSKDESNYSWDCIYTEGDKAWMRHNGGTAYVWTLDGKSICLPEEYNIDFSQNPKDQVPF